MTNNKIEALVAQTEELCDIVSAAQEEAEQIILQLHQAVIAKCFEEVKGQEAVEFFCGADLKPGSVYADAVEALRISGKDRPVEFLRDQLRLKDAVHYFERFGAIRKVSD